MYKKNFLFNFLRSIKTTIQTIYNSLLDSFYYIKFSSMWDWSSDLARTYFLIKVYHRLEKSLSFIPSKPNSGWKDFVLLLNVLKNLTEIKSDTLKFHIETTIVVMNEFYEHRGMERPSMKQDLYAVRKHINVISAGSISKDILHDNEPNSTFSLMSHIKKCKQSSSKDYIFQRRVSCRAFINKPVCSNVFFEAVEKSIKAPSACNRQPWHIYTTSDRSVIEACLALQNGNRGFAHKIYNLAIICADLKAFDSSAERYQPFIDGGIFAGNLLLSLASMDIDSCTLNWGVNGSQDKALRKIVKLSDKNRVVLFIAYGYGDEEALICKSERRPTNMFLTELKLR